MYRQVKTDLEKIYTSLNAQGNNEGSARALDYCQDSDYDFFRTLLQATRVEISSANSSVNELNDRLSRASDAVPGSHQDGTRNVCSN